MQSSHSKHPFHESEDEEKSPEFLLPAKDPYPSDDERCTNAKSLRGKNSHSLSLRKQNSRSFKNKGEDTQSSEDAFTRQTDSLININRIEKTIEKKSASDVTENFVRKSFHVSYKYPECATNCTSLDEVLKAIFDFTYSNTKRKTSDDKTNENLYDGMTISSLILEWNQAIPKLQWIVKNFDFDFSIPENSFHCLIRMNAFMKQTVNSNLTAQDFSAMKPDDKRQFCEDRAGINFAKQLQKTFDSMRSCSVENKAETIKPLLGQIGALVEALVRFQGQLQYQTNVFVDKNAECSTEEKQNFGVDVKEMVIVTNPEFMFMSDDMASYVPVEVYSPNYEPDHTIDGAAGSDSDVKLFSSLNLSRSQKNHLRDKFHGQHTMQLIATLHEKVQTRMQLQGRLTLKTEDAITDIGLFVVNQNVFFTKIKTSPLCLHYITHDIFVPVGCKATDCADPSTYKEKIASQENFFEIEISDWCIDLRKPQDRNALVIFLAHYMHATW